MKSLFAIALGLTVAWGTPAFAEDDDAKPEELFQKLDKNSDGTLTASEIPDGQVKFFDRLLRVGDKNDDGKLSKQEFLGALKRDERPVGGGGNLRADSGNRRQFDPQRAFKFMDRNKDGKVTKDEVPEQARKRLLPLFERLGKDALTQEDFAKLRPGGQQPAGGRQREPSPEQAAQFFKRLDANSDGMITIDEVPEQGKRMLQGLLRRAGKKAGDSITRDEFTKLLAQGPRPDQRRQDGQRPKDGQRPRDGERRRDGDEGRPRDGKRRPPEGQGGFRGPLIFRLLDQNRDGRISKQELSKAGELFEKLDENKDGSLDPREMFGPPPGGPGFDGPPRGEGRPPEGERGDRPRQDGDQRKRSDAAGGRGGPDAFFKRLDRNQDGKISKDEAPEKLKENFSRFDQNSDGGVDLDEFKKVLARRSSGGRPKK